MRIGGFTLLELLITLAIGAILLLIGVPGLQYLIADTALQTEVFSFHNALHRARSYAIDHQTDVIVCLANRQEKCVEQDFSHLLVFSDNQHSRKLAEAPNQDTTLIRHTYSASVLNIATNQRYFVFQPDGTQAGTPGTISLCSSGIEKGIGLTIAMSGRVRRQSINCSHD